MTYTKIIKGLLFPLLIIICWQHLYNTGSLPQTLSAPSYIADAFYENLSNGQIFLHTTISLQRMMIGLLIAIIIGVSLGILMSSSAITNKLFTPTFRAFMQISAFAWIPIISVWFGNSETARIIFIAFVCIFPIALNTYEGFMRTPVAYKEAVKVLNISSTKRIRLIFIPSAMPSIIAGIELGMLYAWLATIGAELLMGNGFGVGALMLAGQELFRMDVVFMGVVICSIIGFMVTLLSSILQKVFIKTGSGAIR